jgi:transposase
MKAEAKEIDHLGIVAGIMKDLEIVKLIDEMIKSNDQEKITDGQAVIGMILNGLGFASRPLMLVPQFFRSKALTVLITKEAKAEDFNRFKLSRTLDNIAKYGCEKFFSHIAFYVCEKEKVDISKASGDTTSISVDGNKYVQDEDIHSVTVTHGHSKDHRPDLKQVVHELMVSQDGGIPLAIKTWDGNASDTKILQERACQLIELFKTSKLKCFIADSKLYAEKTSEFLKQIRFITRVPGTIKKEQELIVKALSQPDKWHFEEKENKVQEFAITHFDFEQRWVVVHSEQARIRSQKTLQKEAKKEKEKLDKDLFHLQVKRFGCKEDALASLNVIAKKLKYHFLDQPVITEHKIHNKRGRPSVNTEYELGYQINASIGEDKAAFNNTLDQRSCFVLATNIPKDELSAGQVLLDYKAQNHVEKGFAFLKSPEFFTSSFFIKKPSRIEALLVIMTLSLLVYTIAQRRLRKQLKLLKSTIPNQIHKPVNNPTMRWVFQIFEGINLITVNNHGVLHEIIDGIDELRQSIIDLLGPSVQEIYKIQIS